MSKPRCALLSALLLFVPLLTGCVELDGQRITLVHDPKSDALTLLIAYEGIHPSAGGDAAEKARGQIVEFATSGSFMLLDWYGRVDAARGRDLAERGAGPALGALTEALGADVSVTTIGHYRDGGGRVSALQKVTLRKAGEFLEKADRALAERVVGIVTDPDRRKGFERKMPRTLRLLAKEAKDGRRWLRLDGHSIVASLPFDPAEWRTLRADFIESICDEYAKAMTKEGGSLLPRWAVDLAGAVSETLDEEAGRVTLRLGDRASPRTFRFRLRDVPSTALEDVVRSVAPAPLDEALAAAILGDGRDVPPEVAAIAGLLPPEDRVRAVLSAARGDDRAVSGRAAAWLAGFAEAWNAEERLPAAPSTGPAESRTPDPDAWAAWLHGMSAGPAPR